MPLIRDEPAAGRADVTDCIVTAMRVCALVCSRIDELWRADAPGRDRRGALHDTTIYRACDQGCGRGAVRDMPRADRGWHGEIAAVVEEVLAFLGGIGMLDGFAELVTGLVDGPAFRGESEDLRLHRCLLVGHAVTETYMRLLQERVAPSPGQDGRGAGRYPKGDVKEAVLTSMAGPILGHHQILTLNCATCSDEGMSPAKAFMSYRENLRWFNDWATADRADGDIMAVIDASAAAHPGRHRAVPDRPVPDRPDGRTWMWRERNQIGEAASRWLARLDHATKPTGGGSLLHTGVLCAISETVRKLTIACVCYGSYHFWPVHRPMTLDDYALYVCASVGEMLRGWAVDHDSEAAIGEHNLLNWLCVHCATRAARDVLSPRNASAPREDWEMRIAWGPQTYFFHGLRHRGFARRVDNLCARPAHDARQIPIILVRPRCVPIRFGDSLPVIVSKLLALCGVHATVPDEHWPTLLHLDSWACRPRICARCAFDGQHAQLFMLSVGCATLATLLPPDQRGRLVHLVDTYGVRLLPALQVRLLVQCACVPRWTADVMSHGYQQAGTACGQNPCQLNAGGITPHVTPGAGGEEDDRYQRQLLRDLLLQQAHAEAARYAADTGQTPWLAVVSRPLAIDSAGAP
jgi:hypothetical protein